MLQHLSDLVGQPVDCLLCGLEALPDYGSVDRSSIRVLAGSGNFEDKVDLPVDVISDDAIRSCVAKCVETQETASTAKGMALPLVTRNGMTGALYLSMSEEQLEELVGSEVVKLFVSNVALGYEKTGLLEHIRNLAYVDRVTGLSTFSGFIETFPAQCCQPGSASGRAFRHPAVPGDRRRDRR